MTAFFTFMENHLSLLILLGTLTSSFFAFFFSLVWWKFTQETGNADTRKEVISLKDTAAANQKDVSEVKDRIGNIETAMDFIKNDMKLIKDFIFLKK